MHERVQTITSFDLCLCKYYIGWCICMSIDMFALIIGPCVYTSYTTPGIHFQTSLDVCISKQT